jgi:hypothetical protein
MTAVRLLRSFAARRDRFAGERLRRRQHWGISIVSVVRGSRRRMTATVAMVMTTLPMTTMTRRHVTVDVDSSVDGDVGHGDDFASTPDIVASDRNV